MPINYLPESSTYTPQITQLETTDYATGGLSGTMNKQAKELANRTNYLKAHMDVAEAAITALQTGASLGPAFAGRTDITASDVDPTLTSSHIGQLIRVVGTGNDITLMPASVLGANKLLAVVFEAAGSLICQGSDQINDVGVSGATYSASAGTLLILTSNGSNRFYVISKSVRQDSVPAGAVQAFAMDTAPAGWLKANGANVSRTQYPALFAAIGTTYGAGDGSTTFTLPDLRGEFIRGFDDGRGVDSGRTIGSTQADDFKSHTHGINTTAVGSGTGTVAAIGDTGVATSNVTKARGGTETRPRNIAMLYCIKS